MKSRIERVIEEFLNYVADRYDQETLRHYSANMQRFMEYIQVHTTHCAEYHSRYSREKQKPPEEQDTSWMKEYWRIRYVEDLDRDFISRYVAYVNHDEISKRYNQPLNQSEKESRLYPLKTFLKYCLQKGYLQVDLRRFIIVPPREKKILERVLTPEEMAALLEVPDTSNSFGICDRALLELSYSALRSEEMLGLDIPQVDTVTNAVTILDGKGNKDRVVPMTQEALYWMKRWISRRGQALGDSADPKTVFINKRLRPIERRTFERTLKGYAKKAAIPIKVAPHDLRRASATHLAQNGASIRQIQALLGHATLAVTTKYLRLPEEKIKAEYMKSHPANRRDMHYGHPQ